MSAAGCGVSAPFRAFRHLWSFGSFLGVSAPSVVRQIFAVCPQEFGLFLSMAVRNRPLAVGSVQYALYHGSAKFSPSGRALRNPWACGQMGSHAS